MIAKLGKYRANVPFVINYLKNNQGKPIGGLISQIAVATMVPAVVIAHYVGELQGYTPEVKDSIERLVKFYGYTDVSE